MFGEELHNVGAAFLLTTNWANSNNVSHILEFLSDVNNINEVIHHRNLLFKSALFLELGYSAKGITHNSNQDIQEHK
jgi:hypothetical protein